MRYRRVPGGAEQRKGAEKRSAGTGKTCSSKVPQLEYSAV